MPSSLEQRLEESQGCVEGVLVEIEPCETAWKGSVEVCLAKDKGEEHDLILLEEIINEGVNAREFRIVMGGAVLGRVETLEHGMDY